MKGKMRKEIPVSGDRYDMTLVKAGLGTRKREIAHFVIDNGEFKGQRVGLQITSRIRRQMNDAGLFEIGEMSVKTLNEMAGKVRLSARLKVTFNRKLSNGVYVEVPRDYDEHNVYVHYDMSEFQAPFAESELSDEKETQKAKFKRLPTDETEGLSGDDAGASA